MDGYPVIILGNKADDNTIEVDLTRLLTAFVIVFVIGVCLGGIIGAGLMEWLG